MKEFKGVNIPQEYLPDFTWVRDIQYFEGALTSEYKTTEGEIYVFHWCDSSESANRWLVVKSDRRSLYLLTSGLITMRGFFTENILDKSIFLLDIANEFEIERSLLTHISTVAEYLPEDGVLISQELMPKETLIDYPILIDKEWETNQLSEFPRKFMDAYVLIAKFKEVANLNDITQAPWNGGASSMGFYQSLRGYFSNSLGIKSIQYASPGYIKFTANRKISGLVRKNLESHHEHRDSIYGVFSDISKYLRDNKLNKDDVQPNIEQIKWMKNKGEELMKFYSEPTWEWILESTPDTFRALKMSMSYYRRIKAIDDFVQEGKVQFPKN